MALTVKGTGLDEETLAAVKDGICEEFKTFKKFQKGYVRRCGTTGHRNKKSGKYRARAARNPRRR